MSRLFEKLRLERDKNFARYADSGCQENPFFREQLENDKVTGKRREALLTRTQLARFLNLSPSYLSKLQAEAGLPVYRIGRAVRFRLGEVEAWLEKRKRYE
jgi:excisionase family DNA binding protein